MNAKLTYRSGNKKTGPMPVSTSGQETCPKRCPFRGAGCFGEHGPISWRWRDVTNALGETWAAFVKRIRLDLPRGVRWRHNQVGDLPHINEQIDEAAVGALCAAQEGCEGFTYTHHEVDPTTPAGAHNLRVVRQAITAGFTVNVSTETMAAADRAVALGLPAVVVVKRGSPRRQCTPGGTPVLQCPATYSDVTCRECPWCARPNRKFVVAFPAHGQRAATVERVLDEMQAREGAPERVSP